MNWQVAEDLFKSAIDNELFWRKRMQSGCVDARFDRVGNEALIEVGGEVLAKYFVIRTYVWIIRTAEPKYEYGRRGPSLSDAVRSTSGPMVRT